MRKRGSEVTALSNGAAAAGRDQIGWIKDEDWLEAGMEKPTIPLPHILPVRGGAEQTEGSRLEGGSEGGREEVSGGWREGEKVGLREAEREEGSEKWSE